MNYDSRHRSTLIHSTAIVEGQVKLSAGVRIWSFSHVCEGAELGENVIIGESVYVGPFVKIGKNSKIQSHALIYEPTEIGDGVFVGPGTVFTNDFLPRAVRSDGIRKESKDWNKVAVKVSEGASIGAGAVCVAPITIGSFAMIAAGAVVTRDVLNFERAAGNPIRNIGWNCYCGLELKLKSNGEFECIECKFHFVNSKNGLKEKK